jgi:hypothetical protein
LWIPLLVVVCLGYKARYWNVAHSWERGGGSVSVGPLWRAPCCVNVQLMPEPHAVVRVVANESSGILASSWNISVSRFLAWGW